MPSLAAQGLWNLPDTATLVGHAIGVAAGLAALDGLLLAIGRLVTAWTQRV